MSRSLRLEFPGAFWHVTNRGVEKRATFLSDTERRRFLDLLADAVSRFQWRLHAYVLMSNHFHLLIETLEPTLSRGMKEVEGNYASYFNWRHDRVGHLFQGRFKSHLVDSETYFLEVARYIILNPVRACMVPTAGNWQWSSYRGTAGIERAPAWLTVSDILARFDRDDPAAAASAYREFVAHPTGIESPWDRLVGQIYLGDETFVADVRRRIAERERSEEHPLSQRAPGRPSIDHVAHVILTPDQHSTSKETRMAFAILAREEALATLSSIGERLAIGTTGARYLINTGKRRSAIDSGFAQLVKSFRRELTKRHSPQIKNCKLQT